MRISAFYENIVSGLQSTNMSLDTALKELKNAGLDTLYANAGVMRGDYPRIQPLLKKYQIGIEGLYEFMDFSHKPWDRRYRKVIDLAQELGATHVLLVPGFVLPGEEKHKERMIRRMIKGLARAAAYGKKKNIMVTLEDFDGPDAPFNSIDGLARFLDETPGLTCAFDTGNFIMYHEDELAAFARFKDKTTVVHVKDRSEVPVCPGDIKKACIDGTYTYPCTPGKGTIHIPEIIAQLKKMQYDGCLISEMYDCDPDSMIAELSDSLHHIKDLWKKAEQ